MTQSTRSDIAELQAMRLPELQARYAEVFGEETRAPNKKYLVRTITAALAAATDTPASADAPPTPSPAEKVARLKAKAKRAASAPKAEPKPEAPATDSPEATADAPPFKLSKLSVPELQALYVEVVGRPTSSVHAGYLKWKIRQAQKGKIPVGPRKTRRADGPAPDFKVLPLRMEAEHVTALDEARARLGLKNRMELFRAALNVYLDGKGEADVAALFAAE